MFVGSVRVFRGYSYPRWPTISPPRRWQLDDMFTMSPVWLERKELAGKTSIWEKNVGVRSQQASAKRAYLMHRSYIHICKHASTSHSTRHVLSDYTISPCFGSKKSYIVFV